MGFLKQVLAEAVWYFVGLDLGQSRDHSALAVVERADLVLDEIDHVTYARLKERRYRVPFLERVALGTPYPNVVERVREVVRAKPLVGRCTLVVDATGVGAPVVDLLRRAQLGCGIEAMIQTGGERGASAEGIRCVAKQDLVAGLRLMLENRELGLPFHTPTSIERPFPSALSKSERLSESIRLVLLVPLPFSVADKSYTLTPIPESSPRKASLDNWPLYRGVLFQRFGSIVVE
jgi:hypothetical protein